LRRPSAANRKHRQAADRASLNEIGHEFGGRHHTTVLHAINRIELMRLFDKALNSTIMQLMDGLGCETLLVRLVARAHKGAARYSPQILLRRLRDH
jgi:hypothetical protein